MNNEELIIKRDLLIKDFQNLEIYQDCLSLVKAIREDSKLAEYKALASEARKSIARTTNTKEQLTLIEKAREYEALYAQDPKVINYHNNLEQLQRISDALLNILNK